MAFRPRFEAGSIAPMGEGTQHEGQDEWRAARVYNRRRQARRRAEREAERQHWLERAREAILRVATAHPGVRRVYLYGSLVQPGRFRADSDIDVAVACDSLESETPFWRDLERALGRDVDLRPLTGPIEEAATTTGEQVYG
jgi:predicted nucleotidyltransferase